MPTTVALSYQSGIADPIPLVRCHAALAVIVPGIDLAANAGEERANIKQFQHSYESVADYLREATRDKARFRLVFAENVNHGFRRNRWAMKQGGVAACLSALAAVIIHASRSYLANQSVQGLTAGSIILSLRSRFPQAGNRINDKIAVRMCSGKRRQTMTTSTPSG